MIYVYPRKGLPFTLEHWENRKIPNRAYVKTRRNWHHKVLDRVAMISVEQVPKPVLVKHLLVQP